MNKGTQESGGEIPLCRSFDSLSFFSQQPGAHSHVSTPLGEESKVTERLLGHRSLSLIDLGSNLPIPSWGTLGKHLCLSQPQTVYQLSLLTPIYWAIVGIKASCE